MLNKLKLNILLLIVIFLLSIHNSHGMSTKIYKCNFNGSFGLLKHDTEAGNLKISDDGSMIKFDIFNTTKYDISVSSISKSEGTSVLSGTKFNRGYIVGIDGTSIGTEINESYKLRFDAKTNRYYSLGTVQLKGSKVTTETIGVCNEI